MITDKLQIKKLWTIRKYEDDLAFEQNKSYEVSEFEENVLLNEGIALLLDLLIGAGGTVLSNANAFLGVGDSTTAAAASQTALQAATNKVYVAMATSYPQRSGQTVTWRSVFDGSTGNFAWNEFTVSNGNSDAAVNLNRKVEVQGTKASGQTWTLDLAITLS